MIIYLGLAEITELHNSLVKNGVFITDFEVKMEDIAIGVAKNELGKEEIRKIFRSMFSSFGYVDFLH